MEVTPSATYRPLVLPTVHDTFILVVPQLATYSAWSTPRLPPPVAIPVASSGSSMQQTVELPRSGSIVTITEGQQSVDGHSPNYRRNCSVATHGMRKGPSHASPSSDVTATTPRKGTPRNQCSSTISYIIHVAGWKYPR